MRLLSDFAAAGKILGRILGRATQEFRRDHALEMSAALSYYSIFSLAPLLVIVIAVAGIFFGREAAEGLIFTRFRDVIGPEPALALEAAVELAARPRTGGIATSISVITLLLGASGVFGQLRSSLDRIWDVEPARAPWRVVLRTQLLAYAMVLLSGLLLLISLVLNTVLAAFGQWASQYSGDTLTFIGRMNALIGYVIVTAMFATVFKTLPDVRIGWRDVWIGALITSLLFAIGRSLIGLYIVRTGVGSSYGLAGSVLIILAWVYYSALIFFFGAECTSVFAHEYGTAIGRAATPKPLLAEAKSVPKGMPTGESPRPRQGPPG
jgi:membrane protein